jgi:group I intron endonuclease
MRQFYVYKILNTINGKVYIGKSNSSSNRWKEHLDIARGMYPRLYFYLHKSMNKYGSENFIFEILEYFDDEANAYLSEIDYIAKYQSHDPKRGMNLNMGGLGQSAGLILSDEAKKKIGDANRGENSGVALFTNTQIKQIKLEFHTLKLMQYRNVHLILANKFGASKTTITDIVYGLTYKDVIVEIPTLPSNTKVCSACHIIKNTSDFYTDKYSKDGLVSRCIECLSYYNHQNYEKRKLKAQNA